MKKSTTKTTAARKAAGYNQLVTAITAINTQMVGRVATVANQALVLRNWIVGAYIVEFEQNGADRAKYGARLLETLAKDILAKGIKGLDERTLRACRTFFSLYPQIRGPVDTELSEARNATIRGAVDPKLDLPLSSINTENIILGSEPSSVADLPAPLEPSQLARISWTHFLELIRIDDPWKRAFYENEIILGHWSKRQLQPSDAGQMNFYVNWFKANMMTKGDNPPVGILLCSDKDSTDVEFATAGMDQKLFVSRYLTQLPSPEQLKAFLERDRAQIKALAIHEGTKDRGNTAAGSSSAMGPSTSRQSTICTERRLAGERNRV